MDPETRVERSEANQDSRELWKRFEQEEAGILIGNYRLGGILGVVFTILGSLMDAWVYRELVTEFFVLRLVVALLLVGATGLLFVPSLQRFARSIGHALAIIPFVNILVMIAWAQSVLPGDESPYYAGLNLVMVASFLVMRWRFKDGVFTAAFCLAGYLAVEFAMGMDPRIIGRNSFFLVSTSAIACLGLYYFNLLRFREFCLREAVLEQQEELAENNRKLQDLDEAKTRFFANISHELRTPLTLILAPVEKLRASMAVRGDTRLSEMVDSLEDNGLRLLRLINDLLDLVRLDSGEMPLRPERFSPATFIEGLGRNLRPMAERKRIHLTWTATCDESEEVYIDRDRLEKIILNLAVNALKFTPPGGRVALTVGIEQGQFELEVADTGAGMKQDQVDAAFERFWQADTSIRRKHRGVGIGLALVKSLTESLGGTVDLESVYGEGTTFRITVPLGAFPAAGADAFASGDSSDGDEDVIEQIHQKARLHGAVQTVNETAGAQSVVGRRDPGRSRILVAEDESGLRRFLRGELEEMGCDVIEAGDGAVAWELARQYEPELIILDFMMPEMDGITLTRRLRDNDPTSQLPIILVTAHADDTPRVQALEAGVSDFLTKPFTTAELRVRIRNLLDRQRYQRQLAINAKELSAALEELKENETRLLQAEKLSSLGRMSAGIVHEVNNPLNYTKTALHALKMYEEDLPEGERADFCEMVADAEEGVGRVISIVSDLRSFTRGEQTMREFLPVKNTVEMARRLVSSDLSGIRFEDLVPEGLMVEGNENQLCQVFVNLIQNATQSLDAARRRGDEPVIRVSGQASPGGRVMIEVIDNGSGIQPEDLENIFDPFFTKREVGEGMGLGLSIVHRIIESHDGRIAVESALDRFTRFSITLPGIRDGGDNSEMGDVGPLAHATATTIK